MKAKEAKKNASTAPVAKKDKFVGNAAGATVSVFQIVYSIYAAVCDFYVFALSSPRAWL